jgi:hypothetical protein
VDSEHLDILPHGPSSQLGVAQLMHSFIAGVLTTLDTWIASLMGEALVFYLVCHSPSTEVMGPPISLMWLNCCIHCRDADVSVAHGIFPLLGQRAEHLVATGVAGYPGEEGRPGCTQAAGTWSVADLLCAILGVGRGRPTIKGRELGFDNDTICICFVLIFSGGYQGREDAVVRPFELEKDKNMKKS